MNLQLIEPVIDFLSAQTGKPKETFLSFIEHPPSVEMGHYAFPCFSLAKEFKKNPTEISQELAQKFTGNSIIEKVIAQGPYLNFFLNKKKYQSEIIQDILKNKNKYGHSSLGKKKTILIEYSSPNIAKSFHVGHLRATILGQALKNMYAALGYRCIGMNYLGDMGTQFGKLITAFKHWGNEKELKKNPIHYLNSLYVRFHEEAKTNPSLEDEARSWSKKCEERNKEALTLWKQFKDLSLKEFKKIYKILNIKFNKIESESLYIDVIDETIQTIKQHMETKISDGALIIDLEKYNLPPALLLRADGASLYLTRDIAALLHRFERYRFDKIVYVAGDEQSLHFRQLFKLIELMNVEWFKECHHIAFGQIRLKDQKMSTREGKGVLFEELFQKSTELISKIIEEKNPKLRGKKEVAQKVGIGALTFADFSSRRIKNVVFDWDVILNPEGDTGPYVLYTYARASSILRKAKSKSHPSIELVSPEEQELIRYLERFPNILRSAAKDFEPSYIANYLLEISKLFNRFYHAHRVIQDDAKLQSTRLKLVQAIRQVLSNGLLLLGIKPVEEL